MAIEAILIDSREPQWCRDLAFGGVPKSIVMLEAGDLQIVTSDAALLVIERKTASDFLNTLRDDRLYPQMAKIREASQWTYLFVCGDLRPGPGGHCLVDGRETGWMWAAVSGALLTVQELGVHFVQVASDFEYEESIIRLGNRDRQTVRIAPARDVAIISEQEQILAALPGIGAQKAQLLVEAFGTPWLAIHYLTVWDRYWTQNPVPGIGDGTKRKIRRALGIADGFYIGSQQFPQESKGE
jgi:ERCC4-type nuclease